MTTIDRLACLVFGHRWSPIWRWKSPLKNTYWRPCLRCNNYQERDPEDV